MPPLALAVLAAALAGFSRGFAAFGTAMIYVPLVALAYDTQTAVVTLFLIDLLPALPLIVKAAPHCDWRTMIWMATGAIASSPAGVAILRVVDPRQAQLALSCILIVAASWMLARQVLSFATRPRNGIIAGAVSGFAGGLCGIFGPPAMIYLLGRSASARQTRADTIIFLSGESLVLGLTYLFYGMYNRRSLELAGMLTPIYALCLWFGARHFSRTHESAYRRVVLWLLWGISAVLMMRGLLALG